MEHSGISASWLGLEKAWKSVDKLKEELKRTENKLQQASRSTWRFNKSNLSVLREVNPLEERISNNTVPNKNVEVLQFHKPVISSAKLQSKNQTENTGKYIRKVNRREISHLKNSNYNGLPQKIELLELLSEDESISGTFPSKARDFIQDATGKKYSDSEYSRTESDGSSIKTVPQAIAETKIHYINDQLPVSSVQSIETKVPQWIKSSKKPSQKGLQRIREVVEKQKQQIQIASFQNEDWLKSNYTDQVIKENGMVTIGSDSAVVNPKVKLLPPSKNELVTHTEGDSENNSSPRKTVELATLTEKDAENISSCRKVVSAAPPSPYRGFSSLGDKQVKQKKVEEQDVKHSRHKSLQRNKMKRVRKVVNTTDKRAFITPSCWRDAQKIIMKKLGPLPASLINAEKQISNDNNSKHHNLSDNTGDSISLSIKDDLLISETNEINEEGEIEKQNRDKSESNAKDGQDDAKVLSENTADEAVLTNQLSHSISWKKGKMTEQIPPKKIFNKKRKALKQTEEKNVPSCKIRHYDPNVVRSYIAKQKTERKQKQQEERKKKMLAEEFRQKHLQELYAFQKQAAVSSHTTLKGSSLPAKAKDMPINDQVRNKTPTVSKSTSSSSNIIPKATGLDPKNILVDNFTNTEENFDDKIVPDEEISSVPVINDISNINAQEKVSVEDVTSNNSDKASSVKSFQETYVPDERILMLKAFATSIQDQISLETLRIQGLIQRKSLQQQIPVQSFQNPSTSVETGFSHYQPSIIQKDQFITVEKVFDDNDDGDYPGVSNVHRHVLEVSEMQRRNLAATKIQCVYKGYKTRKLFKVMINKSIGDTIGLERNNESLSEGPIESEDDIKKLNENAVSKHTDLAEESYLEHSVEIDFKQSSDESERSSVLASHSKQSSSNIKLSEREDEQSEDTLQNSSMSPVSVHSIQYSSDFVTSVDEEINSVPSKSSKPDTTIKSELKSHKTPETSKSAFTSSKRKHHSSSKLSKEKPKLSASSASVNSIISHNNNKSFDINKETSISSEVIPEDISSNPETSESRLSSISEGPISSVQESESEYSHKEGKLRKETNKSFSTNISNKPEDVTPSLSYEPSPEKSQTGSKIDESSNAESVHTVSDFKSQQSNPIQTVSNVNRMEESVTLHSVSTISDSDSSTMKKSEEKSSDSNGDEDSVKSKENLGLASETRSDTETLSNHLNIVPSTHVDGGVAEPIESAVPSILRMCMTAELSYLETLNNSLAYMTEFGHFSSLANNEAMAFAQMLQHQDKNYQEQQQKMLETLIHQQKNQTQLLEEAREEQRRLLQNTIAEAHAAISEKTFKVVEMQAEAVKSSANALLHLTESRQTRHKESNPVYSSDFEQIEENNDSQSPVKSTNVSSNSSVVATEASSTNTVPEELENTGENKSHSKDTNESMPALEQSELSNSVKQSELNESNKSEIITSQKSKETTDDSIPESLESDKNQASNEKSSSSSLSSSSSSRQDSTQSSHLEEELLLDKSVQVPSASKHHYNPSTRAKHKSRSFTKMDSLTSLDKLTVSTEEHHSEDLHSLISDDSFTKFTVDMVHRLAKEEQMRTRHQLAQLQLQEKELMEKAKAELACLELLKKKLRQKGANEKVSSVRKRQRALLLQLHQERAQLRWLREIYRNSIHKNKYLLQKKKLLNLKESQTSSFVSQIKQQIEDSKSPSMNPSKSPSVHPSTSTDDIPSEKDLNPGMDSDIQTDISSEVPSANSSEAHSKTSEEIPTKSLSKPSTRSQVNTEIPTKSLSKPSTRSQVNTEIPTKSLSKPSTQSQVNTEIPTTSQHPGLSLESLLQGLKRLETSKKYLTKREQKLVQRRKDVEHLLKWQEKLNDEETEIQEIEKQLLEMEKKQKYKAKSSFVPKDNLRSTDIENNSKMEHEYPSISSIQTEVEVSPNSSIESQENKKKSSSDLSESAITEKLSSTKNVDMSESILEQISTEQKKSPSENDLYSESFESTDHSVTDLQQQSLKSPEQQKSSTSSKRNPLIMRIPLIPRTHRRHDSSGSEDSFTISQSETDQSDIEGRIHALSEELKQRQKEAERLKKEQKRRYYEQLKEREMSLQKQIEVYDQYIQKAKKELEQQLELAVLPHSLETSVKPQIKQPRVAESRRLRRSFSSGDNLSPPSEILKLSFASKTSDGGDATSIETEKEASLSQTLISAEGPKSSLVLNTEDDTLSKPPAGEGDVTSSTSASIISTDESQNDASKSSIKDEENSHHSEEKTNLSEKSGLTQSEVKQTVIQDSTNISPENEDTEIEVDISEDSEVSSIKIKLPLSTDQEKSDLDISQIEEKNSSNLEIISSEICVKEDIKEVSSEITNEKLVDKLTDNIFKWLCKDTFMTFASNTLIKQQRIITEESVEDQDTKTEHVADGKCSEIILEKISETLIKDSVDCVLNIIKEQRSRSSVEDETINERNQNVSEVSRKVTSILATLNDKKLNREQSRPQDLMILSPLLDNIEDSNWEITTDLDEPDDIGSSIISNQKHDFLDESEWFDDDFGFGNKDQKPSQEELLQYQNYYRQIPDKPPPPYIFPSSPFHKFDQRKSKSFSVVARDRNTIEEIIKEAAENLSEEIESCISFNNVEIKNYPTIKDEQDLTTKSQQWYKQFLFNLTKEVASALYSKQQEKPPPWIKTWKLNRKSTIPKENKEFISAIVSKTADMLINMQETSAKGLNKNDSVMKLGRKKRDFVDNILIRELREEEHSWTNYEQDEVFIKTELADAIFNILIEDTIKTIQLFQQNQNVHNKHPLLV